MVFMRNSIFLLILCLASLGHTACSGNAADNSAASNASSAALPEFNSANDALTAGDKLLEADQTEKAIEAYDRAVKIDPEFAEGFFKLGIAYALIEAREKSLAYSGDAEPTAQPDEKKPKEKKTNSAIAFEKAAANYKKLLEKDPNDDTAYFNLGRSYNKLNEDEDAARALREAVKLKPDDTEYQTELGAILIKLARYGEAVGVLRKALDLDADNSRAEELLADAQAGQKRIGFTAVKKDDKKDANVADNTNANVATIPNENSNKAPATANPAKPAKSPKLPANKP